MCDREKNERNLNDCLKVIRLYEWLLDSFVLVNMADTSTFVISSSVITFESNKRLPLICRSFSPITIGVDYRHHGRMRSIKCHRKILPNY